VIRYLQLVVKKRDPKPDSGFATPSCCRSRPGSMPGATIDPDLCEAKLAKKNPYCLRILPRLSFEDGLMKELATIVQSSSAVR